jgi:hypothetical protein
MAPKYIIDSTICLIAHFYVVNQSKVLQRLQYIVPRKKPISSKKNVSINKSSLADYLFQ